ncbi:HNH endonuclease [Staphylococcus arlettae]|uniref:HNH endonuclease n=1 Tax=Staphylococcus arlettae TaxID=29378 RepID=UPI0010720280|nr:HNH endonuclease [Staphylococcus arlettae]MBF0737424.1 HNH endonuclease [Staphylococcus arlettae]TFU47839.1 HNH endonuclease [Staphylococcus arlettae]
MARSINEAFYKSSKWEKCRNGYMSSQHYICERCGNLATICHHKVWLNQSNVSDPFVTLNWDNLEALCHDCHNREHFGSHAVAEGLQFDEKGNLIKI